MEQVDNQLRLQKSLTFKMKWGEILAEARKQWPGIRVSEIDLEADHQLKEGGIFNTSILLTADDSYFERVSKKI